jgi:hypothetical protein
MIDRPVSSTTSSRVEFDPQSIAATTSGTDILNNEQWFAHVLKNEFTNRITGSGQIIGKVRVQTFHPNPSAPNAALGLGSFVAKRRGSSTFRVGVVRALQFLGFYQCFEAVHTTVTFETTHFVVQYRIDEPEKRRHWRTVTKMRFVLYYDGLTRNSSHNDSKPAS